MSSITPSLGVRETANQPHQAFVTTGAFSSAIFSYTTGTTFTNGQFVTTGVLTELGSTVESPYNAAGTVLRLNGRKLIPDVHPITTGTKQYYVGVYHPVFGSGFIDPNNPLFVPMTSDKTSIFDTSASGYYVDRDAGPGVRTTGTIYAASATTTGGIASGGSILSSSNTEGIGYSTGAGGTVTQGTDKSTAVTLNTICGTITMNGAQLNAGASVAFTLNNTSIGANDLVAVNVDLSSTASDDSYLSAVRGTEVGKARIQITNLSGGNLSEAVKIKFIVIKSVIA